MRQTSIPAILVLLLLGGCFGSAPLDDTDTIPAPAATPKPKEMYIVATDFSTPSSEGFYKFRPQTFQAKVGDEINVTIKNAVGNRDVHNLVLPDLNVRIVGIKDLTASFVFNATKAGSFKYYCDKVYAPNVSHRQVGFEGTLTISAA